MRKYKKYLIGLLMISLLSCSVPPAWLPAMQTVVYAAANISLSKTTLNVQKGKSSALKLNNAPAAKVNWSSSNSKIAKVNKRGKVTGKKFGTANIIAKYDGKKYVCKVFVCDNKIKANKTTVSVENNATTKVKITYKLNTIIYFKVEDPSIVLGKWSQKWKNHSTYLTLTGEKPGKTRVKIYDESGRVYGITVTVKAPWEDIAIVLPETLGEKDSEGNRMKITGYSFFEPGLNAYKMKIDYEVVKKAVQKENWVTYFYCYDKNNKLIMETSLFAADIKVGKKYSDTVYIPNKTYKIVFMEYPEP